MKGCAVEVPYSWLEPVLKNLNYHLEGFQVYGFNIVPDGTLKFVDLPFSTRMSCLTAFERGDPLLLTNLTHYKLAKERHHP